VGGEVEKREFSTKAWETPKKHFEVGKGRRTRLGKKEDQRVKEVQPYHEDISKIILRGWEKKSNRTKVRRSFAEEWKSSSEKIIVARKGRPRKRVS